MKIQLIPYDQKTKCPICDQVHSSDIELYTAEGIQTVRDLVEPVRMKAAPKLNGTGDFAVYNVLCEVRHLLEQLDEFIKPKEKAHAKTDKKD